MLLRIQPYDCTIEYKPGPEMTEADCLSRANPKAAKCRLLRARAALQADRAQTIRNLFFAVHEIPDQLMTDNVRQFVCEELTTLPKSGGYLTSRQARITPSPTGSPSAWFKPSRRHSRHAAY
ncbi:hypothetical protein PoB_006316900 [Plakobranchus ocellatus]|uniref:Uncharacterized protein n=1 Tax=Plakobranchus ocellatus TaxID=259542 RepID=A0AAV4CXM5_9GAST|nr:hypothetical protein PoB_006316900 [Plakobranchus ocellatus]